ncbi:unnamed protein product [Mytilus edulis]|uniref:DUF6589 domain-containing protein n=1 Tax=Mytilus edulis TaxID=6550 RepID=A0A8S3R8V6_MYTED|nr:unnamed protein product [Mytilus edulis]
MADMLRKLFLGPVENDNEEEEINSEENLERNQSRVEQLGYVPDSFEDQSLSISQIVDRIDEGTSDRNENGTDRNIFNALSNKQSEMKELQNAVLLSNRFRVEGQIRKDLSIIAKNNFGKNIFKISDSCKKRKSSKSLFTKKGTQATKWDHIITAIRARQYRRAIKGLYGATKGSKRSFIEVTKDIVRKEISELLHSDTGNSFPLFQKVNIPNLESFSWDEALTKLQYSCPLLYNALKGAMTTKQCENSLVKGGLKRELIKQLAHTGICKGYDTTLAAVDNISSDFDSAAVVCKEKIEGQFRNAPIAELWQHEAAYPDFRIAMAATMQNIEDEIVEPSTSTENTKNDNLDDTIPYGLDESDSDDGGDHEILEESSEDSNVIPSDEDLCRSDEDIAEIESGHEEVEQEIAHPGFTMSWDNVGKKVTTRNPSEDKKNVYLNMALGYIGVNRVQTTHLDWEVNCELKKAVNLSPGIFVPNAKDTENLENRMKVIVSRIITRHLRWFNRHLGDCTTPHILHEYSKESSERSILINLGVFDVDPSSTQGAITIYENLQRYIPSIREKPYTSIVFGDGLSCERGNDAHRARCNGLNPWERLEGCEPAVQGFHKEMLLLQDNYDEFFKGSNAADRGTIRHLKNFF